MRALVVIAALVVVLGSPSVARADSILELGAAINFPVSDKNWTDVAEPSPMLAARIGAGTDELAGIFSASFCPQKLDNDADGNISAQRYRLLANVEIRRPLGRFKASVRIGAGADIAHGSYEIAGFTGSDTNIGFAFDASAGVWFPAGGTELGAVLGLPVGYHSKKATLTDPIGFDYTQIDIELWFVLRLGSKH